MKSIIIPLSDANKLLLKLAEKENLIAGITFYWDNLNSDGVLLDTGAKLRIRDGQYVIDGYAHDGSDVSQITDTMSNEN